MSFIEGACLDWFAHRDLTRKQLRRLLLEALGGALAAARALDPKLQVELPQIDERPDQDSNLGPTP